MSCLILNPSTAVYPEDSIPLSDFMRLRPSWPPCLACPIKGSMPDRRLTNSSSRSLTTFLVGVPGGQKQMLSGLISNY